MKENLLTNKEGYLAMISFLEKYYERTASDDIGALLGDLQLDEDGSPFDPAVLEDWNGSIVKVLSQNKTRGVQ